MKFDLWKCASTQFSRLSLNLIRRRHYFGNDYFVKNNTHISFNFLSPLSTSTSRSYFSTLMTDFMCIDAFCARQFGASDDPAAGKIDANPEEFLKKCLEYVEKEKAEGREVLVDGYAPFCKHIFVPNFTNTKPCYIEITSDVEPLIKTSYAARTEKELPVLNRFVEASSLPANLVQPAKYLDLILYSREQIKIENEAMGNVSTDTADWGIVSIKPQNHGHETPMQPITMMRNALGADQGGSGIPLDTTLYRQSVDFWSKHITIS